ncbi:MAG TPA: peptidoglycan-binding domain-containing protein [Candidatus Limiplasma sp.]|nr:peptidoglycan-binding domain-containing protein [Candidatus Limiplasma sp.]HRX08478.1 peptidoglycan-binding domain-containing protein [Candidatus Limiplasma sp.]
MKKAIAVMLVFVLCLTSHAAFAQSVVPDQLPDDLGGKTFYGYVMDLKNTYLPAKVFQDAVKYTDLNREDARRAARLIVDAVTAKLAELGAPDQYYLYLRGYCADLLFQDTGDEGYRETALADYKQVVDLGGTYAQTDYDRLAALEVKAGPLSWQVPQMLTLAEAAEAMTVSESDLVYVTSGYTAADGSRTGAGYAMKGVNNTAETTIWVLADPQGSKARFDVLKTAAFLMKTEPVEGIGDEALLMGVRNLYNEAKLYSALLVRKGELVLRVLVPYAVWSGDTLDASPALLAQVLAEKLLANLYDTERSVPGMTGLAMETYSFGVEMNAGTADSPVPDAVPADFGGKTEYGYLAEMRNTYLPAKVYGNADLPAGDLNNARRAARLVADAVARRLDTFGQNPYELEIRAACYKFAYQDSGIEAFRALAINDYKQALYTGYAWGKKEYDELAGPLLEPMAEMALGATGEAVTRLQEWLMQINFMDAPTTGTFDELTKQAVELFESENGLAVDGIADIAFLLTLYSRIDDLDVPLP